MSYFGLPEFLTSSPYSANQEKSTAKITNGFLSLSIIELQMFCLIDFLPFFYIIRDTSLNNSGIKRATC